MKKIYKSPVIRCKDINTGSLMAGSDKTIPVGQGPADDSEALSKFIYVEDSDGEE